MVCVFSAPTAWGHSQSGKGGRVSTEHVLPLVAFNTELVAGRVLLVGSSSGGSVLVGSSGGLCRGRRGGGGGGGRTRWAALARWGLQGKPPARENAKRERR